jgi:hypothetical protein
LKLKIYPYLVLDQMAENPMLVGYGWPTKDEVTSDGGFRIALPTFELDVPIPDANALKAAAVQLLRATRRDKMAEHANLMTWMQFQENQLLGLAAPEVLDAAPDIPQMPERDLSRCMHCLKPKSQHQEVNGVFFCTGDHDDSTTFEEDDIPF